MLLFGLMERYQVANVQGPERVHRVVQVTEGLLVFRDHGGGGVVGQSRRQRRVHKPRKLKPEPGKHVIHLLPEAGIADLAGGVQGREKLEARLDVLDGLCVPPQQALEGHKHQTAEQRAMRRSDRVLRRHGPH